MLGLMVLTALSISTEALGSSAWDPLAHGVSLLSFMALGNKA